MSMNKIFITGNCTRDPEVRTTTQGKNVCVFSVAVNRRRKVEGQPEADFFRVSAWDALGDNCAKYLVKGKKVAVVGSVSVHPYKDAKGDPAASLEVVASEVEFLSPRSEDVDPQSGYQKVQPEGLPY
jgi:single-strand DNA-binding protein